jgi:hypothetical protein
MGFRIDGPRPEQRRVPNKEHQHCSRHRHSIEDIDRPLDPEQRALASTDVLDDAEDVPKDDKPRNSVQHHQRLLPLDARIADTALPHAHVKNHSRDDKQAECNQLEKQAAQDDILAQFDVLGVAGHDSTTATLNEKRQDIANHKNLREPGDADDGVLLRTQGADQSAESHVDGCCKEGGCDEDKQRLDDVVGFGLPVAVAEGAADVAYGFDWRC